MINKREFNAIMKRTLAQVYDMAKPYVRSDLMTLWYEIEELKKAKVLPSQKTGRTNVKE